MTDGGWIGSVSGERPMDLAARAGAGHDGAYEVEAAGGVVCRPHGRGWQVAIVHRPRYDDWTFPKGKLEPGELAEQAALREVEEETGMECRLGEELSPVTYIDHRGRRKRVRYWAMTVAGGAFEPNAEVDELRWLDLDAAVDQLTYPHDRTVLESFTRS
ncbi:NUDIX hydrolase [Rhabdothermincola sp.]|uniref:NUDIX hydrolase n=1 Tax=Rhabdothermincola sp. TaxID=2820405 RepID=UPI002FE2F764